MSTTQTAAPAAKIKSSDLQIGQEIYLTLSAGFAGPAVYATVAALKIEGATEKAVQMRVISTDPVRGHVLWLPRKAICKISAEHGYFRGKLAPWFKPTGHTAWVFSRIVPDVLSLGQVL